MENPESMELAERAKKRFTEEDIQDAQTRATQGIARFNDDLFKHTGASVAARLARNGTSFLSAKGHGAFEADGHDQDWRETILAKVDSNIDGVTSAKKGKIFDIERERNKAHERQELVVQKFIADCEHTLKETHQWTNDLDVIYVETANS